MRIPLDHTNTSCATTHQLLLHLAHSQLRKVRQQHQLRCLELARAEVHDRQRTCRVVHLPITVFGFEVWRMTHLRNRPPRRQRCQEKQGETRGTPW